MRNKLYQLAGFAALFLLPFFIWVYLFRGFFAADLALTDDGMPYFEHAKFFLDNISRGFYPLWDPSRDYGIPNEFYLRRIGSFNPFLLIILLFQGLGISFVHSYMFFLGAYFFLGLLGFWILARLIYRDMTFAFLAYWLMMFSSFSTVLFNSFLVYIFTPAVWFFCFAVSFAHNRHSRDVLGMTFCLMIILTTYLPFYFFTGLIVFLFLFACLFFSRLRLWLVDLIMWSKAHKWLVLFCAFALIIALIPGVLFFQEGKKGSFVLMARHQHSSDTHSLSVAQQTTVRGGILATNLVDEIFTNHRHIRNGIFYFPIFTFMLFLSGMVCQLNRRIVLLTLWAFALYIVSVYDASPIYAFLYKHIFYFKYMRNFQFFLWMVILPAFILISVEHFRLFCRSTENIDGKKRLALTTFLVVIHGLFLLFLSKQQNVLSSAYLSTVAGAVLMVLIVYRRIRFPSALALALLMILVVAEPVNVYAYLPGNSTVYSAPYRYTYSYRELSLPTEDVFLKIQEVDADLRNKPPVGKELKNISYVATKDVAELIEKIPYALFTQFAGAKIILYDNVEYWEAGKENLKRLQESWVERENVAFVTLEPGVSPPPFRKKQEGRPDVILDKSPHFKLIAFDPMHLKFEMNLDKEKFLVYLDSYDSRWNVYINGKRSDLFKAQKAFKGIWVPAGENVVEFRYEPFGGQLWPWSVMVVFMSVLALMVVQLRGHVRG